jgi:hypothetical protein
VSGERPAAHQRHAIPPQPDSEPEELDPEDFEELPSIERPVTLDRLSRFVAEGFATLRGDHRMIRREMLQLREDLSPRVAAVESRTLPQKAAHGAALGARYGTYIAFAVLVLNGLAKRYPELQQFADLLRGLSP